MQYKYAYDYAGHYTVLRCGKPVARIERDGAGDGWNDTWWWLPQPETGLSGLQTASSLRSLKQRGEAWFNEALSCHDCPDAVTVWGVGEFCPDTV